MIVSVLHISSMAQTSHDEANVIDMIEDWREETLDLESLLHSTSSQTKPHNGAIPSQAPISSISGSQLPTTTTDMIGNSTTSSASGLPAYPQKVEVPTFSSSANRPSVLDLSTTIKFQERQRIINHMNSQQQQQRSMSPHQAPSPHSPHSPHHSPYMQNNPAQQVFNYNNTQEQHSPVSPHQTRVIHSPVSPHGPNMDQSPHSPHMPSGPISPHPAQPPPGSMSPHSPYSMPNRNAVSPVSPHHGMVSPGQMSPHHISNHSGECKCKPMSSKGQSLAGLTPSAGYSDELLM